MSAIPHARPRLRLAAGLAWVPSLLWALIMAIASLAAAYSTFQAISGLAGPAWLDPLRWAVGLVAGWLVATFSYMGLTMVSYHLIPPNRRRASRSLRDVGLWNWYHHLFLVHLLHLTCGWVRGLGWYRLVLRGLGAHIGKGSIINTTRVYDPEMIHIGRRVLIGGDAWLVGHVAEGGRLVREPIRIGDGSSIGLGAIILPGASVGKNCHVGAGSVVPKGAVLDDDAVYAGAPARKVRDLRPQRPRVEALRYATAA